MCLSGFLYLNELYLFVCIYTVRALLLTLQITLACLQFGLPLSLSFSPSNIFVFPSYLSWSYYIQMRTLECLDLLWVYPQSGGFTVFHGHCHTLLALVVLSFECTNIFCTINSRFINLCF